VGGRGQLDEILIAGIVFSDQRQVISLVIHVRLFLVSRTIGDIYLTADDGLDAGFFALGIEFNGAVHDAVVGEGDGILAVLLGQLDHILDLGETV